ncbi:MAG: hypothetical protein HW374_938 [Bacteroidetes bacterium]|nr:hypothetical protein [Bacteroidota bacterium]
MDGLTVTDSSPGLMPSYGFPKKAVFLPIAAILLLSLQFQTLPIRIQIQSLPLTTVFALLFLPFVIGRIPRSPLLSILAIFFGFVFLHSLTSTVICSVCRNCDVSRIPNGISSCITPTDIQVYCMGHRPCIAPVSSQHSLGGFWPGMGRRNCSRNQRLHESGWIYIASPCHRLCDGTGCISDVACGHTAPGVVCLFWPEAEPLLDDCLIDSRNSQLHVDVQHCRAFADAWCVGGRSFLWSKEEDHSSCFHAFRGSYIDGNSFVSE